MRNLLRVALEDSDFSDPLPEGYEGYEVNTDAEVVTVQHVAELDQLFAENEATMVAVENLSMYHDMLSVAIESHQVNPQMLNWVRAGVQVELNRLSHDTDVVSLESGVTGDSEAEIALEVIGKILKLYAQDVVLYYKQFWHMVIGWIRTTEGNIGRLETKLASSRQEFLAKKSGLDNNIEVSLHRLWNFFSNGRGMVKNFSSDVGRDLATSKYILVTYPTEVMGQIKKLTSTLKGAKGRQGILNALKSIDGMKNPGELFERRYLGDKVLLNNVSLEYSLGARRTPVTIDGKDLRGLADLASPKVVKEARSYVHLGAKFVTHEIPYVNVASAIVSNHVEFTKGGLEACFDYGDSYLEYARKYLKLSYEFGQLSSEMERAITLMNQNAGEADGEFSSEAHRAFAQVSQYAKNLANAFTHPATAEVKRAIYGAKYCMWLGLRGIFNG